MKNQVTPYIIFDGQQYSHWPFMQKYFMAYCKPTGKLISQHLKKRMTLFKNGRKYALYPRPFLIGIHSLNTPSKNMKIIKDIFSNQ